VITSLGRAFIGRHDEQANKLSTKKEEMERKAGPSFGNKPQLGTTGTFVLFFLAQ
jgi:hypothetical protein